MLAPGRQFPATCALTAARSAKIWPESVLRLKPAGTPRAFSARGLANWYEFFESNAHHCDRARTIHTRYRCRTKFGASCLLVVLLSLLTLEARLTTKAIKVVNTLHKRDTVGSASTTRRPCAGAAFAQDTPLKPWCCPETNLLSSVFRDITLLAAREVLRQACAYPLANLVELPAD